MVLGLDIHALTTASQRSDPSSSSSRPFHPPRFVPLPSSSLPSHSANLPLNLNQQQSVLAPAEEEQNMIFMDASYLDCGGGDVAGGGSGLDYDLLDMSPSTFEAFTQVEPLSTTMNPGFDFF